MRTYTLSPPPSRFRIAYASELNPEQLQVVMAGEGAVLVIAGAGTGKTRALTYRVARLIESGYSPDRIALCTFTNKASREMLSRVEVLAGAEARGVWGGTFHHLANRWLRQHADTLGYSLGYTILDEEDAKDLLASCVAEREGKGRNALLPRASVLAAPISFASNTLTPLEQVILHHAPELIGALDDVLSLARDYRERKRAMNTMDFDDLLENLRLLLQEHPQVRQEIAGRLDHVLVDEYQDTNRLQCEIVDMLASVHRNLTVVGDDAQSIYGFRGANPDNILGFRERWPEAVLHRLQTNYRSSPQVLALANASIVHNRAQVPKQLSATRPDGALPALVPLRDPGMQAAFTAQRICELAQEGRPLSTMAVLYRAHHQSLELQLELTRRQVPFLVRSGVRFFEQAHIKDVLAHLRLAENSRDALSWLRVLQLQPGIGKAGAHRIVGLLSDSSAPTLSETQVAGLPPRMRKGWESLNQVLSRLNTAEHSKPAPAVLWVLASGYEERLASLYPSPETRREDLQHLAEFAAGYVSIRDFLAELNLLSGFAAETVLAGGDKSDRLTLSSVHQAKGLEWDVVFVIGLNEGSFPHPRALADERGEAEERRLFHVAVTRTRQELYLTHCLVADRPGNRRSLVRPSRFLDEICREPGLVERWSVQEQRGAGTSLA